MNFLAHYVIASRYLTPAAPLSSYVVGTALPDLLPLASRRSRLRPVLVNHNPALTADEAALRAGVLVHLATDTAFHKTAAFIEAQTRVSEIFSKTTFEGIHVRRFFLAHVLTELALDAVLLRAHFDIAEDFYTAFAEADFDAVKRWTEAAVGKPLPELPAVLKRFAQSRYLFHYADDEGVATGLSLLCARARQDTFDGANHTRLVEVVGQAVVALAGKADVMLRETADAMIHPPTTSK